MAIYTYGYGVDAVRPTRSVQVDGRHVSERAPEQIEQLERDGELSLPDVQGTLEAAAG